MAIETIGGRKRGFALCDVRLFPITDPEEPDSSGYVTACSLLCAQKHAAELGYDLTIESADEAEDEDDMGICDHCGYPDPTAVAREED